MINDGGNGIACNNDEDVLCSHTQCTKNFSHKPSTPKKLSTQFYKRIFTQNLLRIKNCFTHLCFRRTCFTQRSKNIQTFHEILTHRAVLYMKVMKVTLYIFFTRQCIYTQNVFTPTFLLRCIYLQVPLHTDAFTQKNVKQKLLQVLLHTGAFTHASASTNKIALSDPRHGISRHIFWQFLTYILTFYLAFYLTSILAFYLLFYLASILASILAFYLASVLAFFLTFFSDIPFWHSI